MKISVREMCFEEENVTGSSSGSFSLTNFCNGNIEFDVVCTVHVLQYAQQDAQNSCD